METNSNVSSRSIFEETNSTDDNESNVSRDAEVTSSGGYSLRNAYSFLRRLNRKTITDWSYF